MKSLKIALSISLCSLFIGCSTPTINTPDKDKPINISEDKNDNTKFVLNPTILNWKIVLERINELEKDGKVKNVIMTKSLPPKISLTTNQETFNLLKSISETKPEMKSFNLSPTINTSDEILKTIEELKKTGEVESAIMATSYPPKISIVTTQEVFNSLNSIIENDKKIAVKSIFVDSVLKECYGVGKQQCMQIRENENEKWVNFYGEISGFKFEEGYKYKLEVKEEKIANPPADSSSIKTILVQVLNKEKV